MSYLAPERSMFIGYGVVLPSAPFDGMADAHTEVNTRLNAMPDVEGDAAVHYMGTADGRQFLLIWDETREVDPGRMRSIPTYAGGPVEHWMQQLRRAADLLEVTPLTSPSWIAVHVAAAK